MEDLADDLPLPIDFEQREKVRVPVTAPVVELKPHGCNRVDRIDAGDPCLELRRRTVLVIPVKELLDGPPNRSAPA